MSGGPQPASPGPSDPKPTDRERWDRRYEELGALARPHAAFLEELDPFLPAPGARALDLAGGEGRNARWFAAQGLAVTLCDVSPVALAHAQTLAAEAGLELTCVERDLAQAGLPAGPWDLIFSFHYLQRDLFPTLPELLAPGGVFAFSQPTLRNLERHRRPSARFLLEEGELAGLLPQGLEPLLLEEGWNSEGRHEARVVARRS